MKTLCNYQKWEDAKICLNACEQVKVVERKRDDPLPSPAALLNVNIIERKHR